MLAPTRVEADELALARVTVEVCGFGLAAAGVYAARAIALHGPDRVVLAGIGGSYDLAAAPIGAVVRPGTVRCVGIGAGGRSAAELGFAESDDVRLAGDGPLALSVAAASASLEEASGRAAAHTGAIVEEMEGYAVALAAMKASIPCLMVRGISNRAGDRDREGWRIAPALQAVGEALDTILSE